jgi:hypothetical protein
MLRAQPDAVAAVLFVTAWDELEVKVRLKGREGKRRYWRKRGRLRSRRDLLHVTLQ